MKKLKILKAIIDYTWILLMPILLLLIIGIPGIFFTNNTLYMGIHEAYHKLNNTEIIICKVLFSLTLLAKVIIICSIYYFKKILREFSKVQFFTENISKYLSKMGNLLIISGVVWLIASIFLTSFKQPFYTAFNWFFPEILCICFGLFLEVLSKIFKISYNLKKENELTI